MKTPYFIKQNRDPFAEGIHKLPNISIENKLFTEFRKLSMLKSETYF